MYVVIILRELLKNNVIYRIIITTIQKGAMKMFCTNCGAKIADDACFCGNCGEKINIGNQIVNEKILDTMQQPSAFGAQSEEKSNKDWRENLSPWLSLFGSILLLLFLLGFFNKPIGTIIDVIFG